MTDVEKQAYSRRVSATRTGRIGFGGGGGRRVGGYGLGRRDGKKGVETRYWTLYWRE